jgi:hypothetical protein
MPLSTSSGFGAAGGGVFACFLRSASSVRLFRRLGLLRPPFGLARAKHFGGALRIEHGRDVQHLVRAVDDPRERLAQHDAIDRQ